MTSTSKLFFHQQQRLHNSSHLIQIPSWALSILSGTSCSFFIASISINCISCSPAERYIRPNPANFNPVQAPKNHS